MESTEIHYKNITMWWSLHKPVTKRYVQHSAEKLRRQPTVNASGPHCSSDNTAFSFGGRRPVLLLLHLTDVAWIQPSKEVGSPEALDLHVLSDLTNATPGVLLEQQHEGHGLPGAQRESVTSDVLMQPFELSTAQCRRRLKPFCHMNGGP